MAEVRYDLTPAIALAPCVPDARSLSPARRSLDLAARRASGQSRSPRSRRSAPQYLDPVVERARGTLHRPMVEPADSDPGTRWARAVRASRRARPLLDPDSASRRTAAPRL